MRHETEYTHFMNHPDNPAKAVALKCFETPSGKLYRCKGYPVSEMLWSYAAVMYGLTQLHEMPEEMA